MHFILFMLTVYLLIGLFFLFKILTLKEFHKQRRGATNKELILFFLYIMFLWVKNIKFRGSKIIFEFNNIEEGGN